MPVLGSRISVLGKVIEDELTGIVENYMKHGIPMTNHILRLNFMTLVSACTIDICILTEAIIVPDEVELEDADDEAEEEEAEEETPVPPKRQRKENTMDGGCCLKRKVL